MRKPAFRLSLLGGVAVALGIATFAVVGQVSVPGGPNKLKFPADWSKQVMYATVDRYDTKQFREFYTSKAAVDAARAGQPIPDGTIITLAAYAAKVDANGVPVKDANGRFVKDKLVVVNSMQKQAGWGQDIPADIRNGDWVYQSFSPEGQVNEKANLTACYQCHLPFVKDDYLTNLAKLSGKFPGAVQVAARSGPAEVAIKDFMFGPGTLKVTTGQAITWTNVDDTPHQVTVAGAAAKRSDLMLKGQSATLKFDEPGTYGYICGLHPGMKGTVEVTAKQ
jgi:plastocyanin